MYLHFYFIFWFSYQWGWWGSAVLMLVSHEHDHESKGEWKESILLGCALIHIGILTHSFVATVRAYC